MAEDRADPDEVEVRLSKAEAIVLFEWLFRFRDSSVDPAQLGIEDQAEQRVLWDLMALLERVLVEPFDSDYAGILSRARAAVRDGAG